MGNIGKKKLKNFRDKYGGLDPNDNTKTRMYGSTYSGEDADTKKINLQMGSVLTDTTEYQCECGSGDVGLDGINFSEHGSNGLSSETFCRCPADETISSDDGSPLFYSIKSYDRKTNPDGKNHLLV